MSEPVPAPPPAPAPATAPSADEPKKVTITLVALAQVASVLLAWVSFQGGLAVLAGPRANLTGAARDDYLQGSIIGGFVLPGIVVLLSLIPKGRSVRRAFIVYTVTALVCVLASAFAPAWPAASPGPPGSTPAAGGGPP